VRGVVVLGSNGEAPLVEEEEATQLVAAARDAVPPDRLLVCGAGRESTRSTIAAVHRSAGAGADAVLIRPPGFFRTQMTPDVLYTHYTAVADASPVPVLLYNFAAAFSVDLATDLVARLSMHRNIIGLKESGGDVGQVADQASATPGEFAVVVGSVSTLYASLCVGAVGGIVAIANVVPEACVRLYRLATEGRHEEARSLQRAIVPLARATAVHGVAGLKAVMNEAGYRGGAPRRPLVAASPATSAELARRLAELRAYFESTHAVAS
jgi:4-hydroxy-2-oxoglutarate aldolase